MQTPFSRTTCVAAVAAAMIVGFTGMLLDRSLDVTYDSALPAGTVEICEIPPVALRDHAASHSDVRW
jgi:hypothetical protein